MDIAAFTPLEDRFNDWETSLCSRLSRSRLSCTNPRQFRLKNALPRCRRMGSRRKHILVAHPLPRPQRLGYNLGHLAVQVFRVASPLRVDDQHVIFDKVDKVT